MYIFQKCVTSTHCANLFIVNIVDPIVLHSFEKKWGKNVDTLAVNNLVIISKSCITLLLCDDEKKN